MYSYLSGDSPPGDNSGIWDLSILWPYNPLHMVSRVTPKEERTGRFMSGGYYRSGMEEHTAELSHITASDIIQ